MQIGVAPHRSAKRISCQGKIDRASPRDARQREEENSFLKLVQKKTACKTAGLLLFCQESVRKGGKKSSVQKVVAEA